MARVEIYTKDWCGFCARAKRLLGDKGVDFEEYDISLGGPQRAADLHQWGPYRRQRRSGCAGSRRKTRRDAGGLLRLTSTRAALLQMTAGVDPAANAATLVAAITEARTAGADMLFTPEMSGCLDMDRARSAAVIRSENEDEVLLAVRDAARAQAMWVQLGSLAIADPGSGKRRNRSYLIDDQGAIRARYDKMHLFDVDLPSGESWRESNSYVGGEGPVVADTPWGRLGLTICYDLRFPALYQALSEAGAAMTAIPAAFTVPTGGAHWHVLMRARAIENAMFVIAAAQVGRHEDGRATYGHSLVVDPWGDVLLDAGNRPGLHFVDISLGRIDDVRTRIPVLRHRQPIAKVTAT